MKHFAIFLLVFLIFVSVFPLTVSADETVIPWIELLEFSTVDNGGDNLFQVGQTAIIDIATPQYMRCTKIDMLISHPKGYAPTSVKVSYNGTYYSLTLKSIDDTTVRAYGSNIPDTLYANVLIQVNKTTSDTTVWFELLSCRVSSVVQQDFTADAYIKLNGVTYQTGTTIHDGDNFSVEDNDSFRADLVVTDWMKYDSLTFYGFTREASIDSITAAVGKLTLPCEVSYIDAEGLSQWTDSLTENLPATDSSITDATTAYRYGQTFFSVTIDLSGVDRTQYTSLLYCYITGAFNIKYGYDLWFQEVTGSITVADTSNVSWWTRITDFFTDLFDGDSSDAEEFGSSMESQAGQLHDAVDEIDQVTKPDVDDLDLSLDGYIDGDGMAPVNGVLTAIFSNDVVVTMLIITLICAFASYALFGKR